MKVRFACPACRHPERIFLPATGLPVHWQCRACSNRLELPPAAGPTAPAHCALCGNHELYKKKNFPHWVGLTILSLACLGFLVLMANYQWGWAWVVLLGSAGTDGLLYVLVGDVVVCYRCNTAYSGVRPGPEHQPFELTVHERYRQERLRREQLKQP